MKYRILAVQRSSFSYKDSVDKSFYKVQYKRFGIWWTISTFDTRKQAEEAIELLAKEYKFKES